MYTHKVTSEDIYPTGYTVPVGYKIVDFRVPTSGDHYIANRGYCHNSEPWIGSPSCESPRLIVEPLPKRKVVTYTETGETRVPLDGEWFIAGSSSTVIDYRQQTSTRSGQLNWGYKYPIVTRTETEI